MVFNAAPKKKRNMVWATEEWIPVLPLIACALNATLKRNTKAGPAGRRWRMSSALSARHPSAG